MPRNSQTHQNMPLLTDRKLDDLKKTDEERAREIAYDARVKGLPQEEVVKLIVALIEEVRHETFKQHEM